MANLTDMLSKFVLLIILLSTPVLELFLGNTIIYQPKEEFKSGTSSTSLPKTLGDPADSIPWNLRGLLQTCNALADILVRAIYLMPYSSGKITSLLPELTPTCMTFRASRSNPEGDILNLKDEEKAALLKVLKSHKRAIAWKLSDIKGVSPEFCTHKILMEEDYEPSVQIKEG
ncbi:hypothetical protein Tco_0281930 [Tanacetum coccineum]